MKGMMCLICLLVVVSIGSVFLLAQYQYRLNENQLKDNWGNSRWAVDAGSATVYSNVSLVRESVAIPSIQLIGYLPYIIAALIAVAAILWVAFAGMGASRSGR